MFKCMTDTSALTIFGKLALELLIWTSMQNLPPPELIYRRTKGGYSVNMHNRTLGPHKCLTFIDLLGESTIHL